MLKLGGRAPLKPARLPRLCYRLVTIGGGGVVQPAIVARVSTAMIASETFFITESSVPWMYGPITQGLMRRSSAEKTLWTSFD